MLAPRRLLCTAALGFALFATPAHARDAKHAPSNWRAAVAARLQQSLDRKNVPIGTAIIVRFTVGRNGAVSGVSTSGSDDPRALAAVRRMLRRATPLPPFPAGVSSDHVVLTLPISFR